MILAVLCVLLVVVASAVLVIAAYCQMADQRDHYETLLDAERKRIDHLLDRVQAPDLGTYKAWAPTETPVVDPDMLWDDTGMIGVEADEQNFDR